MNWFFHLHSQLYLVLLKSNSSNSKVRFQRKLRISSCWHEMFSSFIQELMLLSLTLLYDWMRKTKINELHFIIHTKYLMCNESFDFPKWFIITDYQTIFSRIISTPKCDSPVPNQLNLCCSHFGESNIHSTRKPELCTSFRFFICSLGIFDNVHGWTLLPDLCRLSI